MKECGDETHLVSPYQYKESPYGDFLLFMFDARLIKR